MKKRFLLTISLILFSIATFCQVNRYLIYEENGLKGIQDSLGNIIVPIGKYDSYRAFTKKTIDNYYRDSIIVVIKDRLEGIIDAKGNVIIEPCYEQINPCQTYNAKLYFSVKKDGKWGMCTKNGKCIIPTVFDGIMMQDRESRRDYIPYIQVRKKINDVSYEGVYDLSGKEIIPADKYTDIYEQNTITGNDKLHYYNVKHGDKEGIYDMNGKELFPAAEFKHLFVTHDSRSSNGFAIVASDVLFPIKSRDRRVIYELYTNKVLEDNVAAMERAAIIKRAYDLFENSSYKKAAKEYEKALNIKPEDYLYFNRALCYYNLEKYQKAINDFNECLKITDRTDLKNRANELLKSSYQKQEEKAERNRMVALAIMGGVVGTANSLISTQGSNTSTPNATYSGTSSNSYHGSSGNSSIGSSSNNRCGVCGGKGTVVEYTSTYGISTKKYCSDCGKEVAAGHYHKTCTLCHGKGYK